MNFSLAEARNRYAEAHDAWMEVQGRYRARATVDTSTAYSAATTAYRGAHEAYITVRDADYRDRGLSTEERYAEADAAMRAADHRATMCSLDVHMGRGDAGELAAANRAAFVASVDWSDALTALRG